MRLAYPRPSAHSDSEHSRQLRPRGPMPTPAGEKLKWTPLSLLPVPWCSHWFSSLSASHRTLSAPAFLVKVGRRSSISLPADRMHTKTKEHRAGGSQGLAARCPVLEVSGSIQLQELKRTERRKYSGMHVCGCVREHACVCV